MRESDTSGTATATSDTASSDTGFCSQANDGTATHGRLITARTTDNNVGSAGDIGTRHRTNAGRRANDGQVLAGAGGNQT